MDIWDVSCAHRAGLEFHPFNGEVLTVRISSNWSEIRAQVCPVTNAKFRAISEINIVIVPYNIIPVVRQCNPEY